MSVIGIVGGVGPYAGLHLFKNILDQTAVRTDQEHLPIVMFSFPHLIRDRTEYLTGQLQENPGVSLSHIIEKLQRCGASVIGIPCNTAHALPIWQEITKNVSKDVILLNMIEETVKHIKKCHPQIKRVGVLSTTGTFNEKLYTSYLSQYELESIEVSPRLQKEYIHPAIYHKSYGIKSNPLSLIKAKEKLQHGIDFLVENGAEAIILGCTELSLVFPEEPQGTLPIIDSTTRLAHSLVTEFQRSNL